MTAEQPLGISSLTGCVGLRLVGDADLSTAQVLHDALAGLPQHAARVHLSLSGLHFIDVAAARELVLITERPGRPVVVMHHPPPSLVTLLGLVWPAARGRVCVRGGQAPAPAL